MNYFWSGDSLDFSKPYWIRNDSIGSTLYANEWFNLTLGCTSLKMRTVPHITPYDAEPVPYTTSRSADNPSFFDTNLNWLDLTMTVYIKILGNSKFIRLVISRMQQLIQSIIFVIAYKS